MQSTVTGLPATSLVRVSSTKPSQMSTARLVPTTNSQAKADSLLNPTQPARQWFH